MPDYEVAGTNAKYHQESNDRWSDVMYVSTAKAFILVFLALAVAVGVGIIVHFAGPGKTIECNCNYPTTDSETTGGTAAAIEQCKDWADEGNEEICSACPSTGTPVTCPTMTTTKAASTPGTEAPPKVTDVRLPTALNPLLYTVEIQPHMYNNVPENFYFNGSVRIKLECVTNTNNITLHINKLNITGPINVYRENDMIKSMYASHSFDLDRQFLVITTNVELQTGTNYIVEIPHFRGPLLPDLAGLYLSSYTRNNGTIYIATSQMQPTDARKTFPCMDEPAIKAEFEITLVRKSHMVSVSNMPIASSENRGNDWVADRFQKSAKMPTYLLAFVICDFEYKMNATKNNLTIRAWARPEAVTQAEYALDVGVHILEYFEDVFNVPYPLPKQDMIAVPDFVAGAMENWGLIVYRETYMLYEQGVSSEENKQNIALTVSHELGHQWFGNLVSPSWWDDLWLNEGFASYVGYLGVDYYRPDWKMFDQFVVSDLQNVFDLDGLISSHPVYVPVAHPDEIYEIFDWISYAKGASIIRMMRFFLGDQVFEKGLTNYLRSLEYGAAFHDDLWYALQNQSIVEGHAITNVKEIMDTWVLQMNYPVITIKYDMAGQITVSQHRYLQDPNATDPQVYTSPFNYTWHVPFTMATSSAPVFNVTSNDITMLERNIAPETLNNVNIPAPDGTSWVIGNPMQYGYYRVNYDERNWNALIKQLRTDHEVIHPINRAQIINDAWSLAKSGDVDMRIALSTSEYLDKEREYVPWLAASTQLEYVDSMLARHSLYGSFMAEHAMSFFPPLLTEELRSATNYVILYENARRMSKKFMQNKTTKAFDELTMNNTGATHLESFMRSKISKFACIYGIPKCVDAAKTMFKEWMLSNDNRIDPGLKSTVYCTAIAEGGIAEWEFALNKYRESNVPAEQALLLTAMACSKQSWILSRYLDMSIRQDEIRIQDAANVIVDISENSIGGLLAWDFFRENWDFVLKSFGTSPFALTSLANGLSSSFNTESNWEELKAFMDSKDNLGSGTRAFEQALEKTRSNINWMNANVPVLQEWLNAQGF